MATKTLTTAPVGFEFSSIFKSVIDTLIVWNERYAERSRLAEMDFRMLNDIGMDYADAQREAGKPFWQA